jgi:hypothetical protein
MLIKTGFVRGRVFSTRAEANLALFEYIDGFYNGRRIQEQLGFLSPIEFEEKYYVEQATAERANLKPRQTLTDQRISISRTTGEPHGRRVRYRPFQTHSSGPVPCPHRRD